MNCPDSQRLLGLANVSVSCEAIYSAPGNENNPLLVDGDSRNLLDKENEFKHIKKKMINLSINVKILCYHFEIGKGELMELYSLASS